MSWKDENAIKRIFNTFKRVKNQIYEQDVEALKQLKESIEIKDEINAKDNLLYLKLLTVVLKFNIDYYKDVNLAIKETSKYLATPLNNHLVILQMTLNNNDKINFFKDKNIEDHSEEIINKLNTNWSLENVEKSLYKTANEFLKDIENYK